MADAGFIELAIQGKDEWNHWARRCPRSFVDFSGADLTGIPFAEFRFPGKADFTRATFPGKADFTRATFSDKADFTRATFSDKADFTKATFSGEADFTETTFCSEKPRGSDSEYGSTRLYTSFRYINFKNSPRAVNIPYESIFTEATFSGRANFSGATFSDGAHFLRAKFFSLADFTGATFPFLADFTGSKFSDVANFTGSIFRRETNFTGTKFFDKADFTDAKFYMPVHFNISEVRDDHFSGVEKSEGARRAIFYSFTNFTQVNFSGEAIFVRVNFSDQVIFSRATFSGETDFNAAEFPRKVDFSGATFFSWTYFTGAKFSGESYFTGAKFLGKAYFTEAKFFGKTDFTKGSFSLEVWFDKALFNNEVQFDEFRGPVDFSNRKFKGRTSFCGAAFQKVPLFHAASIHQGTDFGDIDEIFTDFQSEGAEQSYRTLKLAMGKQQARTEEAAFAALELKSRRYRLKSDAEENKLWEAVKKWLGLQFFWFWAERFGEAVKKKLGLQRFLPWAERCGYWIWEKISGSGRSFFRPLLLYLVSWIAFAASYVMIPISTQICKMPPPPYVLNWGAGFRYSFLKQFSFGAIFRGSSDRISALEKKLFCLNEPALAPWWVDALNATQSLIALTLIFLMGLGIRHKFRLR